MFLKPVKAKGNIYVYLCSYDSQEQDKKFLYGFGRLDKALKEMYRWKDNFFCFPISLLELGCKREDLLDWIKTLETGITKTGRILKSII
jgi:hypothetical protein